MNLLSFIPGLSWAKIVGVLALLAALSAATWKVYHSGTVAGRAQVQVKLDAERLERAKERTEIAVQSLRQTELATRATTNLQALADNSRRTQNEEIARLDANLLVVNRLLGQRPSRATDGADGVPPVAGDRATAPGATGAGLFREDGQFLAGFARDTHTLRVGLEACYARYEAARQQLRQYTGAQP